MVCHCLRLTPTNLNVKLFPVHLAHMGTQLPPPSETIVPTTIQINLDQPIIAIPVSPGTEVILKGSFISSHDGSVIDGATTTWPKGSPGGQSVDAGGLFDFQAGGFYLVERNEKTHEIRIKATEASTKVCSAMQIDSPCLPMRLLPQAQSRLLTSQDWKNSLKGGISVQIPDVPVPTPVADASIKAKPYLIGGAILIGMILVGRWLVQSAKKRAQTPAAQLLRLAKRVQSKVQKADPILAAPLSPAVDAALKALQERKVDASSREGKRVAALLVRLEAQVEQSAQDSQLSKEQATVDELVNEVEAALEAAEETRGLTL
jgi:Skp family chaperone for outer membrane proteins